MWIARLAMSTCTMKAIFALFKDPLKTRRRRERGNTREGLAPNEGQPRRNLIPPPHRRRRTTCPPCTCFLILKPCSPTKNTLLISSWPKPKTTMNPSLSLAPLVPEIFWNGWIPRHSTIPDKSMSWLIISKGTMATLSSSNTIVTTGSSNSSATGVNSWKSSTIASDSSIP